MQNITSRFFTTEDEKSETFFFKLNPSWWSRFYEYPWAANFASKNDTCLDAACGINHPFKFYLADNCLDVYALDLDDRILNRSEIKKDIINAFGEKELEKINNNKYFESIKYLKSPLTKIPCTAKKFDKIYCLSVLEHINDWNGKLAPLNRFPITKNLKPDSFYKTLTEFNRVLKDDGLIILTFDYPNINLDYFKKIIKKCSLKFADENNFNLPNNAIYNSTKKLYCFRAVLKKI